MTLGSWQRAALVVLLGVGLAACGDDDGGRPALRDAGTDGGGGGGSDGGGGTDTSDGGGGGRMCSRPGGQCDVILQNCPTATHGCYVAIVEEGGEPTTFCATAGTAAEGDPCDPAQVTGCLPGLACNNGVCRNYCCGGLNSDCAGGGQICQQFSNTMPIGYCTVPAGCTIVPQSGCDDGEGCYFASVDGTTDCYPQGTAAPGEACGPEARCIGGNECITPGGGGAATCRPLCRMGMTDCATGTCVAVNGLPSQYGVCN